MSKFFVGKQEFEELRRRVDKIEYSLLQDDEAKEEIIIQKETCCTEGEECSCH